MEEETLKTIAEELKMANIISIINNSTIFENLLSNEKIKLLEIVRNYITNNIEISKQPKSKTRN